MTRQKLYRTRPGLLDTIPSGKDKSKPSRPPHLYRGQGSDNCHNTGWRNRIKIRDKPCMQRNLPSRGGMQGVTRSAVQTSQRTQLFPRHALHSHSPSTRTLISCSIHLTKDVSKLSLFFGRPDTIPSGKDTGTPRRLSNWCGKDNTGCNT